MHFKDQVVWITGASSGIGAELALQLAKEGARLILTSRNTDALKDIQQACGSVECALLPADMMHPGNLQALTMQAIDIYGHVDVVIFSAGMTQRSFADETQIQVYRDLMELNFFAPLQLTNYLLPHFKKRKEGHLVVLSSMAGLMGFPLRSGYAASKHALKGYFETLQTENTVPGLNITIVSPGRINTPISMNAITGNGKKHGKMDEGQLHGIPVSICAHRILRAVRHKRKHLIIARSEKLLWWFWWYARPLYYAITCKMGRQLRTKQGVET